MNLRKTAFISGANRGIGKEIFTSLIKNHFSVICSVRDEFSVHETQTQRERARGEGRSRR